jgi:heptosyltransferase-2
MGNVILPGASPGRAILIRFSSLGDVVLALPVAASLKAEFPATEITFLTRAAYRGLLEGQPGIDRVATLEEAPAGVAGLRGFCRGLGAFDVAIDLHGTLRSRICLRALAAHRTLSYPKDAVLRRLWAAGWMRARMARERRHVVDRYLAPLRVLGVRAATTVPALTLAPAELAAAREALRAAGVRDPARTAVLFPGARWPNKRWTAEGFAAVAAGLRDADGLEPVLAGDAADRDRAEAVRALIPGGAPVLAGATDVRGLAAILRVSRLAVANDSGPAHLAAAAGTPVVAVFGPTHEAFGFAPRGEHAVVVSHQLPCRPCTVHGGRHCRRGHRACLDDIAPGEVLAAARGLLA